MHLLRVEQRSIDGTAAAVDLGQSPAEMVALSFADADLAVVAAAWEAEPGLPSLRLANLSALRHPYSVDLYVESVLSNARVVLVRLLGGMDYWRYGVDELAGLARARGVRLAIVPGDERADPRLDEASTLPVSELRRIWGYFGAGGVANIGACLRFVAGLEAPPVVAVPAFGVFAPATRAGGAGALIVFYRAWLLAADTAPVVALADALAARGFRVSAVYVTSLKDAVAAGPMAGWIAAERPDVVVNLTAFSARVAEGGSVLDAAGVPVLQAALSGGGRADWAGSLRGLGAADLAMNVVLPEFDGRIFGGAISFKGETQRHAALEFTRLEHQPDASGIGHVADLAAGWARLARTPRGDRRIACVLSDYPAKGGRTGYAVGLDTPASVVAIARRLAAEGFSVAPLDDGIAFALSAGPRSAVLGVAEYEALLTELSPGFVDGVRAAWGAAGDDPAVAAGAFRFRLVRAGTFLVAVQPDRGDAADRKRSYHDPLLPPRHGYVAFYLWLRRVERVHAVIHGGTHGTLEWLPGKAIALAPDCGPRAVLGAVPLIYPFIVNNPGEAAQAKRRVAAVTIGHLTPPLVAAGAHGAAMELEGLFDEYAEAQSLDPRRAARLAGLIMARAAESGLAAECGVAPDEDAEAALLKLDAWLCDLKDLRIGDGLHVFGADGEMEGLLAALDGRFVAPGPAGTRGVRPTGRNLYSVDPRAVPTRTAWEIGRGTAEALLTRHAQDHGEWPRRIVLDVWGSATMRTGGDDLAQAFALLGVRPRWDEGGGRVAGFDILPLAVLGRPRVDVTLRISGLFRDVFPAQIALFDDAARAVAGLDEAAEDNPLVGCGGARVFGGAPGSYGIGLARPLTDGAPRDALGAAYLAATSHAYGLGGDGVADTSFRDRVGGADAFVHVQDLPGQDVLDADAFAEHEGGFAAAAALLGRRPALYHADSSNPEQARIRTLREAVARAVRGRATNPRWLAGQLRHGFRGAAEIAQTVDHFCAFAALADVVDDRQFDLLFEATLGDAEVRGFLTSANPAAARAIADRFAAALRMGLWTSRRNSVAEIVSAMVAE